MGLAQGSDVRAVPIVDGHRYQILGSYQSDQYKNESRPGWSVWWLFGTVWGCLELFGCGLGLFSGCLGLLDPTDSLLDPTDNLLDPTDNLLDGVPLDEILSVSPEDPCLSCPSWTSLNDEGFFSVKAGHWKRANCRS